MPLQKRTAIKRQGDVLTGAVKKKQFVTLRNG